MENYDDSDQPHRIKEDDEIDKQNAPSLQERDMTWPGELCSDPECRKGPFSHKIHSPEIAGNFSYGRSGVEDYGPKS